MKDKLKQFIIGAVIVSLATIAGYIIGPIEVRFISSLTDNPTLIGAVFAIGALFFAILSIWLGRLSDRIGRNRFLIIGCGLGIIYPLLYASTYNVFQYMGVKMVWAFSSVACGPVFIAYLQDILKDLKKKGQYIGMMYSAQSILGAGAAFLGGWLSDMYGLKAPYFAMAFVFVLATVISLREIGFKHSKIKKRKEKRDLLFGLHYIFKRPKLIFYFIQNTAFSLNWGIKAMLWPLIIFGMTQRDTVTGSVFATMGIVAFLVLPFAGKIVDKTGVFASGHASLIFLGIAGLFLVFANNITLFWIFAAVFAIGEALHGPMQGVLLTENVESKYRGEIIGFDAVFDSIFGMLAPFVAGLLLHIWQPQSVLLVYIGLFWVALVLNLSVYYTKIRNRS
ncbi:MFS transporter [Thermoproteota archaeon]